MIKFKTHIAKVQNFDPDSDGWSRVVCMVERRLNNINKLSIISQVDFKEGSVYNTHASPLPCKNVFDKSSAQNEDGIWQHVR